MAEYSKGMWQTSCLSCGAIVSSLIVYDGKTGQEIHDAWHAAQAQVADDAHWGGMNRPIG